MEQATPIFESGWMVVVSLSILGLVYAALILDKLNQAIAALCGAALMILSGVVHQERAFAGIDLNTIFLLIGMMIVVGLTKHSGLFQFVAIRAAQMVRGSPRALLMVLGLLTAVFSAFLDNVTVVMLIVPISLLLAEQLKQDAYPFLFSQIFFSNVGGTATLIGDPPNILIGSSVGLSFMDFLVNLGPPVVLVSAFLVLVFDLIWGRKMKTSMRARYHVLRYNPAAAITDPVMVRQSLFVIALVVAGFIFGRQLEIETGSVALAGAALLLFLHCVRKPAEEQTKRVHKALHEVEWESILFFVGLFIIVAGVREAGVLDWLAERIIALTHGSLPVAGGLIFWTSTAFSAFINNIPYVATLIPVVKGMAADMGGEAAIRPLWWMLAMGACLAGNGTLVGSSANVIVAGFAARAGQPIGFFRFMRLALPLMLATVVIAYGCAWLRYF
ncbi:MAG: ArsB/NhaD family transporter [Rhodospirillales bacterium]|nr:ArsB/NhaD family transporter [Alphaproteobacteria bacterium]MCB9987627.1 ArsB/NhaD family transporter [Rhodospirillales bacterium]USO08074.1 MAG: ArsB/NhaD family transporter [Rhodospirillales bacterium]